MRLSESVCSAHVFVLCILIVCLLLYLYTQGLSQQHEKLTALLEQMVFSLCPGSLKISHLIKAVIKQDNLGLLVPGALSDQHISWVRVTVNKAVDEDHFTVHFTQFL